MNKYVKLFQWRDRLFISAESTFVIALLNTSPHIQEVDILMSDVFMDQVRSLHDTHTTFTILIVVYHRDLSLPQSLGASLTCGKRIASEIGES